MSRVTSLFVVCVFAAGCGAGSVSPLAPAANESTSAISGGGSASPSDPQGARNDKPTASETQFTGRVQELPEGAEAGTLFIAGKTVTVSSATSVKNGSRTVGLSAVVADSLVEVTGVQGETSFAARLIEILRDPQQQIDGIVSELTGTASAFELTVNGTRIKGSTATEFKGGNSPSFARLVDGMPVHVTALDKGTYLQAARIVLQEEEADVEVTEVTVAGTLSAITGDSPAFTLTVGTATALTTSATVVRRKNETLTLSALATGQSVEVTGVADAEGVITARKIQISGGSEPAPPTPSPVAFDATGVVSARTGTCPAITFVLQGKTVTTSASTQYVQLECGSIADGSKVRVKGTADSTGAVTASWIKKEK